MVDSIVRDRFWSKVNIMGDNDCWEWTACVSNSTGYGAFKSHGKKTDAHRFVYEMLNGEINNSKLFVCHKCNNKKCVNPNHLYLGSPKDNVYDMIRNGNAFGNKKPRTRYGSETNSAKLTEELVIELRKEYRFYRENNKKLRPLYEKYGVTKGTFLDAATYKTWHHVE